MDRLSAYLEPRLEKLVAKYNKNANISAGDQYITLAKVDVDKFSDLCSRYKIEAVPTGRTTLGVLSRD